MPRSTPTSTATRWLSTCRCRWKRRWKPAPDAGLQQRSVARQRRPIIVPSQDIVLGLYYATRERSTVRAKACFADLAEVEPPYAAGELDIHPDFGAHQTGRAAQRRSTRIWQKITRVERPPAALLSEDPAQGSAVQAHRQGAEEGNLQADRRVLPRCGLKETVIFADKLMQNGYRAGDPAGISICSDDMLVPRQKVEIISPSRKPK